VGWGDGDDKKKKMLMIHLSYFLLQKLY